MAVRFLHVADLHLGLRVTRFDEDVCNRIVEARFGAFDRVRDLAQREAVDFVLVAGDLFDDPSVSHKIAERAFAQLESSRMPPVYIIPGNHDPLIPGGVWDRDPWLRPQPTKHTHLIRESKPIVLFDFGVTLFPCPLRGRKSIDDPTEWIGQHPRTTEDGNIRIGLAHGSLNLPLNLPLDDHLIRRDAADFYGLDYLALGHWHKPFQHASADRAIRTAYSGTHEPMRFPELGARSSTGWTAYSSDGDADRFQDGGLGNAYLVTLDGPGAPPIIENREVGLLRWVSETRDVTGQLGPTISEYNKRESIMQTLLQLRLTGVLDAREFARLGDFADNIRDRFHPGSRLISDDVLVEPRPEQLSAMVGDGVLSRVLARLREEIESSDPAAKRVAQHALKMLYRVASEEKA